MPDRRQFLAATAAAALVPLAPKEDAAPMGSVTNPTGSVNGNSLTGLQDAYAGNFGGLLCPAGGVQAQWNHVVLLSDCANACTTGSPYVGNELTVRLVPLGWIGLACGGPGPRRSRGGRGGPGGDPPAGRAAAQDRSVGAAPAARSSACWSPRQRRRPGTHRWAAASNQPDRT